MPRTRSTTRRAFIGEMRTCRATARAPGSVTASLFVAIGLSPRSRRRPATLVLRHRLAAAALPVVLVVTLERAGQRELAELVPDHRLGDEHRHVLAPVVHRDRVAEHLGDDRRTARPGLDDLLGVLVVRDLHLLGQVVVDERTLLQTAWHGLTPLPGGVTTADDEAVARQTLATRTALGLALGVDRVATTGGLALTNTVRVVDRVHRDTADGRALALPPHAAGLAPADVRLVGVADLAHGRPAAHVDAADLTGGHAQRGV